VSHAEPASSAAQEQQHREHPPALAAGRRQPQLAEDAGAAAGAASAGPAESWQIIRCVGWPLPAANPPRPLHVRDVPTLIVHSVFDPYQWAHGLAAQIRGSVLLTRTGDGHRSYHTSECARTATDQYLIRPQAPADRVCEG
jgi:hypothetical protein